MFSGRSYDEAALSVPPCATSPAPEKAGVKDLEFRGGLYLRIAALALFTDWHVAGYVRNRGKDLRVLAHRGCAWMQHVRADGRSALGESAIRPARSEQPASSFCPADNSGQGVRAENVAAQIVCVLVVLQFRYSGFPEQFCVFFNGSVVHRICACYLCRHPDTSCKPLSQVSGVEAGQVGHQQPTRGFFFFFVTWRVRYRQPSQDVLRRRCVWPGSDGPEPVAQYGEPRVQSVRL